MPGDGRRLNRNSCDFCRGRKLRCDRPLPCTNCVSRGKQCHFGPAPSTTSTPSRHNTRGLNAAETPAAAEAVHTGELQHVAVSTDTSAPVQPTTTNKIALLAEVQALVRLARDLEKRIVPDTAGGQERGALPGDDSNNLYLPTPASSINSASPAFHVSSNLDQVRDVVAHLDRVSTTWNNSHEGNYADLVFKIDRIHELSRAPDHALHSGKAIRCVWWPQHDESKVLLDSYLAKMGFIQHIVHHPSLEQTLVDDVYRQIRGHEPVKPGCLVLLLSIIATATHVWDNVAGEDCLFSSPTQANAQTSRWVRATYDVLYAGLSSPTLETIQGILILSFLVCNLEGVSLNYRFLVSTGLLLGRELGLHRIDDESHASSANTLQAEMGRRVWWYLVATDWLMAARHGGIYQVNPRHMMVNKPLNINDIDLHDNGLQRDLPMSQLTEMSYFLQRIRLAEISRRIVDHDLIGKTDSDWQSGYVTAMDMELDLMLRDIPSFFHLDSYEHGPDFTSSNIFIQAYMLNSLLYTARCKLHLKYLISGPKNNPAYMSSRGTCIHAARQIVRAEMQLKYSHNPFVLIRLRLSAILYGIFLAGIVLLIDTCLNGTGLLHNEVRHGEVAEVLLLIEDARSHSLAARNLFESLTQILNKHRFQRQQQQQQQQRQQTALVSDVSQTGSTFATTAPQPTNASMAPVQRRYAGPIDYMPNQSRIENSQPLYSGNLFAQSLEELVDFEGFRWDDLFLDLESSGVF